jgi:basic amino acid/polyamine antiporter, APA family
VASPDDGSPGTLSSRGGTHASESLPRQLGGWSAGALLVGAIIGSGIFRVPSTVAAEAGAVGPSLFLWLAGALITLCAALTMAELATMYPRAGGTYVYLREAYGPPVAFVFGWTRLLLIQPAVLGGIALIFAAYARAFLPLDDTGVKVIAAGVVLLLAGANYRSMAWGAAIQNASTWAKVLALLGLSALAFLLGDPAAGALREAPTLSTAAWGGMGLALIAVLWSYDGWGELLYASGEVKDPQKNLPRALIGGCLVVAAVYLVVNLAYFHLLTLEEVATSELVASDAAMQLFGGVGAPVVAALVMLSTFGALNGALMGGPRVFYAMASDGLFLRRVGSVHPRYGTPHVAVALAGLLGVAYVSVRTFEELAAAFILGLWPFYLLAVWAVFRLRRLRPDHPRPYRTLGYPWVPLVFLGASGAMLLNSLLRQPGLTLFSFGVIAAGIPGYWIWRAVAGREGGTGSAP